MAYKLSAPSPAAHSLLKALGSEESPSMLDAEAGDQGEYAPSVDHPIGYDISIKRKRSAALLRQMLVNAGMGDLARSVNIRQHGGYEKPHQEEDRGDHEY